MSLTDAQLGAECRAIFERKGGSQRSQALLALERRIAPPKPKERARFRGWGKAVKQVAKKIATPTPKPDAPADDVVTTDPVSTQPTPTPPPARKTTRRRKSR